MRLTQQNTPGGAAERLPANDNLMDSGSMGCCVTIIVLFNQNGNGVYQGVAGYHGGGGVENINFASLMAHVPDVLQTRIIVIAGIDNASVYARKDIREKVTNAIRALGYQTARIQFNWNQAQATVDRQGQLSGKTGYA